MQSTLFDQGVELMLVGMGTVFFFLTTLVIAMSLLATAVKRFSPAADELISEEEVAAITAAIARHRDRNS
jgi:oxaloacetate decarboxylase gamma subunit